MTYKDRLMMSSKTVLVLLRTECCFWLGPWKDYIVVFGERQITSRSSKLLYHSYRTEHEFQIASFQF